MDLGQLENRSRKNNKNIEKNADHIKKIPIIDLKMQKDCIGPIQCLLHAFAEEEFMSGVVESFYEKIVLFNGEVIEKMKQQSPPEQTASEKEKKKKDRKSTSRNGMRKTKRAT